MSAEPFIQGVNDLAAIIGYLVIALSLAYTGIKVAYILTKYRS